MDQDKNDTSRNQMSTQTTPRENTLSAFTKVNLKTRWNGQFLENHNNKMNPKTNSKTK